MFAATAFAATNIPIISKINQLIINPLITLLIAVATVVFMWGVWQTFGSSSVENKKEGTEHIMWGLIGLFIMVSAIGILHVICNTIGCN